MHLQGRNTIENVFCIHIIYEYISVFGYYIFYVKYLKLELFFKVFFKEIVIQKKQILGRGKKS